MSHCENCCPGPVVMKPPPDTSWLEMTCACGCGYENHASWWKRRKDRRAAKRSEALTQ